MPDIPNPKYPGLGYPESQLEEFLDRQKINRFKLWMVGRKTTKVNGEIVYFTEHLLFWATGR